MTTLTGTSAVALTWTAAGRCRGLSLRRISGDAARVVGWWEADVAPDSSVAETLGAGLVALRANESTVVVVGSEELACGMAEIDMPALRADELRNAVAFELRRHAPVPDEKLAWGYRVLPGGVSGPRRVRLYYLRQSIWERWLNDIRALSRGVDMAIPPAAALDPVFAGRPVFLGSAEAGLVFAPGADGGRDGVPRGAFPSAEGIFGLGDAPLSAPGFDPGPLAQLPPDRQRAFAAGAILGLYGLSRTLRTDRRSGFPLPYELMPRRHRQSRLFAAALALYVAIVAILGGTRFYRDRLQQFGDLNGQRLAMEQKIDTLSKRLEGDVQRFAEQLRGELDDLPPPAPSLTAALVEITRRVGPAGWCTAFRWREGAIDLQLREQEELQDLERILEGSAFLGDVRQEYKRVQAGVIDRKIAMTARFDLAHERAEPPPARPAEPPTDSGLDDDDLLLPAPVLPGLGDPAGVGGDLPTDVPGAVTPEVRKRVFAPPPPPPPPVLIPGDGG